MNLGYVPCPAEALTPPPEAPNDWAQSARNSAGIVVGGVDYVIKFLTGFSPLEEWVFKPLAGDWGALDRGAVAWTNAGRALKTAKDNLNAVVGQVGDGWAGEAANAFFFTQGKISADLEDLPSACDEVSAMVSALSEAAQGIAELIGAALSELANIAIGALASQAVPVVGQVSLAGWGAKLVTALGRWGTKLQGAIRRFVALADKLIVIAQRIYRVMIRIAQVLQKLTGATRLKELADALPAIVNVTTSGMGASASALDAQQRIGAWDGV